MDYNWNAKRTTNSYTWFQVDISTHTTRIDRNWKVAILVLCTWFSFFFKCQFLRSSSKQSFKQFILNCKCCLRCLCAFLCWPHVLVFDAIFAILYCELGKHGHSMPSLPNFMTNFNVPSYFHIWQTGKPSLIIYPL